MTIMDARSRSGSAGVPIAVYTEDVAGQSQAGRVPRPYAARLRLRWGFRFEMDRDDHRDRRRRSNRECYARLCRSHSSTPSAVGWILSATVSSAWKSLSRSHFQSATVSGAKRSSIHVGIGTRRGFRPTTRR
jgi:hypothetical protein